LVLPSEANVVADIITKLEARENADYVRSKFPPLFSMEAAGRDLISHDSEILILFVAQINCHLFSQQKGFIINP